MPHLSAISSFEEIYEQFALTNEWMASNGASLAATRVATYQKILAELVVAQRADNVTLLRAKQTQYVDVLFEISELNFIYRGLARRYIPGLEQKLQAIRSGPHKRSDEKSSSGASTHPRNTAFELVVAANFARNNFEVDVSRSEDIRMSSRGYTYTVECKRPYARNQLGRRIDEAFRQAAGRDETSGCIAAIDLSAIWNPTSNMIDGANPDLIGQRLVAAINELYLACDLVKRLHNWRRAVCIFFRISTMARDAAMPYYAQQWIGIANSQHAVSLADSFASFNRSINEAPNFIAP